MLSAYDAAYLDVAVRHEIPLATLDDALQKACALAGINIFRMRI
jgi:predicted nucleic acid-binding protein